MLNLGRYEYHNDAKNSHKYWDIRKNSHGTYIASWGRVETSPQSREYSEDEAAQKITEKVRKGYSLAHTETRAVYKLKEKVKSSPTKKVLASGGLQSTVKKVEEDDGEDNFIAELKRLKKKHGA